jgi:hypothetical protein
MSVENRVSVVLAEEFEQGKSVKNHVSALRCSRAATNGLPPAPLQDYEIRKGSRLHCETVNLAA